MLNKEKTEILNVMGQCRDTNRALRKNSRNIKIDVDGFLVPHVHDARILGVYFSENNRFNHHIKIKLNRAKNAKFYLNKLLKRRKIGVKTKTSIYKSYIRPIITYGAPVWCRQPHTSSHHIEHLRKFERGTLRTATNNYRTLRCKLP